MATEEKIDKLLLQKLGGTGVRFYALLLDLNAVEAPPAWIQGYDPLGRGIVLIGDEGLGAARKRTPLCRCFSKTLHQEIIPRWCAPLPSPLWRHVPLLTPSVARRRRCSSMRARGTGKTIVQAGIALVLAETPSTAAGYAGPFRILWVHDSLLSASVKTARSLEQPMWAGCWTLHDDRRTARFTLGGRQLIAVDSGLHEASAQRLRASAHHVIVEELIPSLTDGVGILEEQYDLALSSMLRQDVQTRAVSP